MNKARAIAVTQCVRVLRAWFVQKCSALKGLRGNAGLQFQPVRIPVRVRPQRDWAGIGQGRNTCNEGPHRWCTDVRDGFRRLVLVSSGSVDESELVMGSGDSASRL